MRVTQEELYKKMDEYGNIRYLLEDLKSSKETNLKTILAKYPEVFQEIQDMEEELEDKIKDAEKIEKNFKKELESLIDEYSNTMVFKDEAEIKSDLVRVGLKIKVTYDATALDGMATENPRLLGFRTQEISKRITLNKK